MQFSKEIDITIAVGLYLYPVSKPIGPPSWCHDDDADDNRSSPVQQQTPIGGRGTRGKLHERFRGNRRRRRVHARNSRIEHFCCVNSVYYYYYYFFFFFVRFPWIIIMTSNTNFRTTEKVSESTYSFVANASDNNARYHCEAKNSISPVPQYADVVLSVSCKCFFFFSSFCFFFFFFLFSTIKIRVRRTECKKIKKTY